MSGVVVSSGFVVDKGDGSFNGNSPIVGYNNVVTTANVSATTEDPDFPAINLANPATHLLWKSGAGSPSSEEYLTVVTGTNDDVDYLGIARHNFGSSIAVVSIEGTETEPGSPGDWFELVGETILTDDSPVIFRWTPQPLYAVRLRIQDSQATTPVTPFCAVLYVGKLLLLQRRIYVGHTPISYARETQFANQISIAGNFLGRILLKETLKTTISLENLTPAWYRSYLDPFIKSAQELPFFFAWRPGDYPLEVGYAWLSGSPKVTNQRPNGMMSISIDIEGTNA